MARHASGDTKECPTTQHKLKVAEISGKAWVENTVKDVGVEVWRVMRKKRLVQPGAKGIASSEGADGGEGLRRWEEKMAKLMELLAEGLRG